MHTVVSHLLVDIITVSAKIANGDAKNAHLCDTNIDLFDDAAYAMASSDVSRFGRCFSERIIR